MARELISLSRFAAAVSFLGSVALCQQDEPIVPSPETCEYGLLQYTFDSCCTLPHDAVLHCVYMSCYSAATAFLNLLGVTWARYT